MKPAFSVASVRAVERHLIDQQSSPDELMQLAARAVANAARDLSRKDAARSVVVILAGSGGNGGDGLYAGAILALDGYQVYAHILPGAPQRALDAYTAAGGKTCTTLPAGTTLLIDAVAGLGSARGLGGTCAKIYELARGSQVKILAVDMPTGVDAETGVAASHAVVADATITFGLPRAGHAHAPECGEVIVEDLKLPGAPSFGQLLQEHIPAAFVAQELSQYQWSTAQPVGGINSFVDPTPGFDSDKYSGGVVGVGAGSLEYPGAGILAATAAVRATPSLVRFLGDPGITQVLPEVIVHPDFSHAGRVQAWVVGPGRGTGAAARQELEEILAAGVPTVVDADAITLLAQHPEIELHEQVVLTPHWGEFQRLYKATVGAPDATRGRLALVGDLAQELGCHILLKGRVTTVSGETVCGVNAGHSYAATPGSGDVLSGIAGAVLALGGQSIQQALLQAVALHAHASAIAALTPLGYAPCSAAQIAAAIPEANARLIQRLAPHPCYRLDRA